MNRRPPSSQRLARQFTEMSLAVPQVVTHRVLRMAAAGPNPSAKDRKEFALMGNEKVLAFYQSWAAMWLHAWKAQVSFLQGLATMAWSPALGKRSPMNVSRLAASAAANVMAAGLAPVHAKAVANSKRLSRLRK